MLLSVEHKMILQVLLQWMLCCKFASSIDVGPPRSDKVVTLIAKLV